MNIERITKSIKDFVFPKVNIDKNNKTIYIEDGLLGNKITEAVYLLKGYKLVKE